MTPGFDSRERRGRRSLAQRGRRSIRRRLIGAAT